MSRVEQRKPTKQPHLTVHVHALCWNEARMIPYFFRHYDPIVDRYFIYDNGSTDGSLDILRSHPRVVLDTFTFEESFVREATAHYNRCWKRSRGEADWVFIVNIDEHLYHSRLRDYLSACTRRGITIVVPEGYDMTSDIFPQSTKPLFKTTPYGARNLMWDKPQFFNPTRIEEINFLPGRHTATPAGEVVYPDAVRTKLLHYKYLGGDYLVERHAELGARIAAADYAAGYAYQYRWTREQNLEEMARRWSNVVRVVKP